MTQTVRTPTTTEQRRPRRARTAVGAVAVVAVLGAGCSTSAARPPSVRPPSDPASAAASAAYASGYRPGSEATTAVTRAAGRTFSAEVDDATSGFAAAVGRLQIDAADGDDAAGRRDELAAQADYDAFRALDNGYSVNGPSLDELATDVEPGETFGGLHAVERDLWTSGPLAADVASLAAQAPVAEFLLGREHLGPEAIGAVAVDQLDWVVDDALPDSQEQYSHLGLVDVAATEEAAHRSFSAVQPLARLVDPALTAAVDARFAALDADVSALGDPTAVVDTAPPPAARLALARELDATAATLARLAGELAPFGTAGTPS